MAARAGSRHGAALPESLTRFLAPARIAPQGDGGAPGARVTVRTCGFRSPREGAGNASPVRPGAAGEIAAAFWAVAVVLLVGGHAVQAW